MKTIGMISDTVKKNKLTVIPQKNKTPRVFINGTEVYNCDDLSIFWGESDPEKGTAVAITLMSEIDIKNCE